MDGTGRRRRAGLSVENWDTRAALLWVLVVAERFDTVEESLKPLLAEVHRSGSARGFVAAYSTLGLLKLRLGALPEADTAARVALRVLQEGDFTPGLGFAATVLSDTAVEAGELDEAQMLLDLLPQQGWPAGTVLRFLWERESEQDGRACPRRSCRRSVVCHADGRRATTLSMNKR